MSKVIAFLLILFGLFCGGCSVGFGGFFLMTIFILEPPPWPVFFVPIGGLVLAYFLLRAASRCI